MSILLGPDGRQLKVNNLTPPEHRAYSTDWYMVFVRRRSTREVRPMPPFKALSVDAAYRFAKSKIEHDGDLEVVHIKQRAPRAWSRWEVGLQQRWV
jgi:hypothetical protein